jgi:Rne/Rng family ribonuclease
MPDEILIERGLAWTRAARLANGRVTDFNLDLGGPGLRVGDVLPARISRAAPALGGAFVALEGGSEGFLLARDSAVPLVEGARLAVQVAREPVEDKAARVTARIELVGRTLAWSPGRRGVATSRRLPEPERARLAELVRALGDGFMLRTLAAGATLDALAAEAESLRRQWREIEAGAACLAPRGVAAVLGAGAAPEVRRIALDDAEALGEARDWARRFAPWLDDRLALEPPPLFERHGAEAEFEMALSPRVPLPGGGFLLIESAAALTAVDVNAGDAVERIDPLRLNLSAAKETARQLRLRGIGGLVVIDFLQSNARGAGELTIAALREALADDPTPTQISGMSSFGLVELSRKRLRPALGDLLQERREAQPSAAAVAERAFARARLESAAVQGRLLRLSVAPEVADRLRAGAGRLGRIEVIGDPAFARGRIEVAPA